MFKFIFLVLVLVALVMSQSTEWETLFPGEEWNKFPKSQQTAYQGKLVNKPAQAQEEFGFLQRSNLYQLETSVGPIDVYTGGATFKSGYINQNVEIIGKIEEFELEGQQIRELWPSQIRLKK